jgi:hypothetical protein
MMDSDENTQMSRESGEHVAVRLDPGTLARLHALRSGYDEPYRRAALSDVLRTIVLAGLRAEEARLKLKTPS